MNPSDLILGVDGGGTSTTAWLGDRQDATRILGRGKSGPSNLQAVGRSVALANLRQAIEAAFQDAGSAPAPVAAACLGLAGADREVDRNVIEQWASQTQLAEKLKVVNDALPLLYTGGLDGCGVALIVGTGSLAFGRNSAGQIARSGGWGPLFGDEGSGYAIVLAALRAAARAADGRGPRTALLTRFLEHFGRTTPGDLVSVMYQPEMSRARISGLVSIVFEACANGDQQAESIIAQAATDLTEMVSSVLRQLDLADQPVGLALSGGVALHHSLMQARLQEEFRHRHVRVERMTLVTDPVAGAIKLASSLLKT